MPRSQDFPPRADRPPTDQFLKNGYVGAFGPETQWVADTPEKDAHPKEPLSRKVCVPMDSVEQVGVPDSQEYGTHPTQGDQGRKPYHPAGHRLFEPARQRAAAEARSGLPSAGTPVRSAEKRGWLTGRLDPPRQPKPNEVSR